MKKLGRSFAAALLLLAMSAVALADGQMDIPLTSPTPQAQTAASSQTDATPTTSSTTGDAADQADTTLTDAGLMLFQTLSSIL